MPDEPARVSPLEAHLGYWLRYVSNQVSHAFGQRLARRDVTVAEWVILRELYDEKALVPSLLAGRLGMTRGAISKLADRLAAKKLIEREMSEVDRRFQTLALTQTGRALVPELSALADQNDAEFFDHLGEEEREGIKAVMKDIVRRCGLKAVPVD